MNKNEKVILFVKKELLFPDFGVFKRINKTYWDVIFNRFILQIVRKYRNQEILVVSDYSSKVRLKKEGVEIRTFGEYLSKYHMEILYWKAKKLLQRWVEYGQMKEKLDYSGINLWYLIEEELSWTVLDILEKVEIIRKIIRKENPKKIIVPSSWRSLYRNIAMEQGINVDSYSLGNLDFLQDDVMSFFKRYSLPARFFKLPGVNRREFVKTGNVGKIKSAENNILILGLDSLYYSRIEGVVKELAKSKKNNVVMLTTKIDLQRKLKKEGYNFVSFGDFFNKEIKKKVGDKNLELGILWNKLKNDSKFKDLFKYQNEGLWGIFGKEIDVIFCNKFKWLMYYIETASHLMDKLKINAVATICDFIMPTRSVISVANSKSIPTLIVQQGLEIDPRGRFFLPLTCQKIAVWGEADKRYMEGLGVRSDRLTVTGSSLYDDITGKKRLDKERMSDIRKKLNLESNKETILFASQAFGGIWGEKERGKMLEFVIGNFKSLKDKQVIVKLHPREDEDIPNTVMERLKPKNVVMTKKEFNISELMMISDVMITVNSTVIYDAIILGKPVIIVNLFERPEPLEFVKSGACIGVYDKGDFMAAIKRVYRKSTQKELYNGRKKFIKEYLYKNDGRASERISNLIEKMIYDKGKGNKK